MPVNVNSVIADTVIPVSFPVVFTACHAELAGLTVNWQTVTAWVYLADMGSLGRHGPGFTADTAWVHCRHCMHGFTADIGFTGRHWVYCRHWVHCRH